MASARMEDVYEDCSSQDELCSGDWTEEHYIDEVGCNLSREGAHLSVDGQVMPGSSSVHQPWQMLGMKHIKHLQVSVFCL